MVIRLSRFLPPAAASAVVAGVVATRPLGSIPRAIAVASVVASWILAIAISRRDLRTHASVVLAIAAVTAAGEVDGGLVYAASCAAFLLACLASMRASRAVSPFGSTEEARPRVRVVLTLVLSGAAITAGLLVGLPRLSRVVENRMNAMFGDSFEETTAFSTTMVLGATRGMLLSNAIVLRIDGERPDYLRGAVYDRYHGRFWTTSSAGRERSHLTATSNARSSTTTITLARGAPNGEDMRWFLPPGACDFVLPDGAIEVDGFGVARRTFGKEPVAISFRTRGCVVPPAPVAAPSANDLEVPGEVAARLRPIAATWTRGATTDRQKLDAITHELARFEYSLAVDRDAGVDPIVDFVTVHRAGHCEFFAGALALLARTQGISARVVGGYRVSEVNPLTHRMNVRDRNAHTWVEAWVDGAWRAWDPTPTSESLAPKASLVESLTDVAGQLVERITLLDVGLALGSLGIVFWAGRAVARLARERLRRTLPRTAREEPLPCFVVLTEALARAGHVRDAAEPVETFADRLDRFDLPWASDVASALRGYARLRYGGVGDEKSITRLLTRAASAVASPTREP